VPLTIDAALTRVGGCQASLDNNNDAAGVAFSAASAVFYMVRETLAVVSPALDSPWFVRVSNDVEESLWEIAETA